MYDDFMAGYTFGNVKEQQPVRQGMPVQGRRIQQVKFAFPRTYDTSKFTRMKGPNGEQAEIYATGKMYIMNANGKVTTRKFGSRPFGVRYMTRLGWEII